MADGRRFASGACRALSILWRTDSSGNLSEFRYAWCQHRGDRSLRLPLSLNRTVACRNLVVRRKLRVRLLRDAHRRINLGRQGLRWTRNP